MSAGLPSGLYGPDGWARGWVISGQNPQHRFRRQQGGGGVMFWAAILKNEIIGPFRVLEGVKINSPTNLFREEQTCSSCKITLQLMLQSIPKTFSRPTDFMEGTSWTGQQTVQI